MLYSVVLVLLIYFVGICFSAPLDVKVLSKDDKAFGQAFDEIVVDTSLTVRRKNGARQARTKTANNGAVEAVTGSKKVKRQILRGNFTEGSGTKGFVKNNDLQELLEFPSGAESVTNTQTQDFTAYGPFGSFGSPATGTEIRASQFGKNGIAGTAGLQQYGLSNGNIIDVNFGNGFSSVNGNPAKASSHSLKIKKADGKNYY